MPGARGRDDIRDIRDNHGVILMPSAHLSRFHRGVRPAALVALLLLVAAGCGQKSGVALSAGGDGFGGGDASLDGTGAAGGSAGAVAGGRTGAAGQTGAGAAGGSGGSTGAAGAAASPGGQSAGGEQPATSGGDGGGGDGTVAAPAAGPNDKVGVSDSEIIIGIHAPVTGAAPFPQSTFEQGKDLYWKWLADRGGVHGRNVRVVFRDDQYNPSRAVQVCREMVEKEKAFLLIGGGGADQITACAKYANSVGVPYLSAGVNEDGVDNLATYFAVSQTYAQQSPPLAQLVKRTLGMTKLGIVVADTPSFADAHRSFTAAAEQQGLEIVRNSKINKTASSSETLAEANAQSQAGAEVIYFLAAPTVFIQFAQGAQGQGYNPQYVGPGITSGLNTVATAGCPAIGEARFLSPFMGLEDPDTATYKEAYRTYNDADADDIGLALWGIASTLHTMFEASGADLGRAQFMATLNTGQEFAGGIFPPVKYGQGNGFGGASSHLLRADCGQRRYVTEAKNASGF
jgi:ABC-type branched-subunit amino acid transport system substrate-binding protein